MEKESKREKFVRLAENRTNKAIEMIRLLGNLANKSSYDYTRADAEKIFKALENEIDQAKRNFNMNGSGDKFKLI